MGARWVLVLALVFAGLCGCRSAPPVGPAESARALEPPTEPLTSFGRFELLPMDAAPSAASDHPRIVEGARIEALLIRTLEPTLAAWNERGGDGPLLLVRPRLANLHAVRRPHRTWSGALPGEWTIDLELVLSNADTGALVARPRVQGASARTPGSWAPGDTDRDLADFAVEVLHEYLLAHGE